MTLNSNHDVNELCPLDREGYGILPRMNMWSLQFLTSNSQTLAPIEYIYIKHHANKHKWKFLVCSLICLAWTILITKDTIQICGQICENIHIYIYSMVNFDIRLLLLFSIILYVLTSHHSYIFQVIYLLTCFVTIKYPFPYSSCLIYCFINFYLFCLPFHSFKNISLILLITSVLSNPITITIINILLVLLVLFVLFLLMQRAYSYETCERMDYLIKTTIKNHSATSGIQLNELLFLPRSNCYDNEDLACLSNIQYEPIFITGFHRSGTTLLYEQLCKILPVAYVTPYSILYYNHLIEAEKNNQTLIYANALNKYFQLLGIRNRFIDSILVSGLNSPEEYSFVIGRQRNGIPSISLSFVKDYLSLNSKSYKIFDNLCRKLIYTQKPKSNIVLMKSPWDYGNEGKILKLYPNAKFIHILRNPLEVINSQYLAHYHHMSGTQIDPYWWTITTNLMKSIVCAEKFLCNLIGTNKAEKLIFNMITNAYLNTAPIGLNSIQSLPNDKVYTITYSSLVENPIRQLHLICQFIGIEVCQEQLSKHTCVKKQFQMTDILEKNSQSILEQLDKRSLPTNY